MKRLDLSSVSAGVGFPMKSGTVNFLQDAHKETTAAIVANLLGFEPDSGQFYILHGLVNSGTGATYNVTAGAVYLDGEIFDVPAFSFTLSGSQEAWPTLTVTQYTTNADPVNFTDAVPRNVHNIRKMVVAASTTGSGLQKFDQWLRGGSFIHGDTKEIVCDDAYVAIHFDSTGLGRKERKGWAIMNGNNGTPNDQGMVVMQVGTDLTTLGDALGSEAHLLSVEDLPKFRKQSVQFSDDKYGANSIAIGEALSGSQHHLGESTASGGKVDLTGADNYDEAGTKITTPQTAIDLMQPTVIRLRIMKINV